MNYHAHPYLSNSKLTAFGQEIGVLPILSETDPYDNFRLGTLFDALETEPHLINLKLGKILGTDYTFTKVEYENNLAMQRSLHANPFYKVILRQQPELQKIIINDAFCFGDLEPIGFRAKLDLFCPNLVIDLKTTSSTIQEQFEHSCEGFGYYRQMLLYMILTGAKNSVILGVSKSNHKVFIVKFDENHPLYKETYEMCYKLISRYILFAL